MSDVQTEWVVIDGRRVRVVYARAGAGLWVSWPGASAFFTRDASYSTQETTNDRVSAPMTGRIVSVDVKPGDSVAEGAALMTLEAMKMEVRLQAPRAGIVAEIACSVGDLVDLGATLIVLESE